jgi:hypothetical protein
VDVVEVGIGRARSKHSYSLNVENIRFAKPLSKSVVYEDNIKIDITNGKM